MAGAASHIDLFDYKPALVEHHGEKSDFGEHVEAFQDGLGPWLRPVWDFRPHGRCGKMLGEVVSALGPCVDDMAFVHNMVGKTGIHSQATYLQATGFQLPGFPGMGCWVSYGLGSMNENLPTFVVLPDHRGFASQRHEELGLRLPPRPAPGDGHLPRPGATHRRPVSGPRRRLRQQGERGRRPRIARRASNRQHAAARPGDARLDARIRSYELAARMQLAAPEALDLSKEPAHVLKMYGLDHNNATWPKEINAAEETDYFGRKCLVGAAAAGARRALRADLVGQRQRLPAPQLGLARGRRSATTARWPPAWRAARRP